MATAVLRSQDYLRHGRFHTETLASTPFKPSRNPNPNPSGTHSRRRKHSRVGFHENRSRFHDRTVGASFPTKNMVMGQVKILKRGEELKTAPARMTNLGVGDDDLVLSSTDRLGPEPEMVQRQIKVSDLKVVDGLYAGSVAFLASPPPSSLPFPAFFAKKEKRNDAATSDLRRLLRLDLI